MLYDTNMELMHEESEMLGFALSCNTPVANEELVVLQPSFQRI